MSYTPNPEIFVKAAAHIRQHELYQGYFYPIPDNYVETLDRETRPEFATMRMDVVGAIGYIGNEHPMPGAGWADSIAGKAVRWAEIYADAHDLIDREPSIAAWSDRPGRTTEDAVALLEKLAEGARGVVA